MKYRINYKITSSDKSHYICKPVVQVRKWYGWVTIKEYPQYNLLDPEEDCNKINLLYGDTFPDGRRNIAYYDLCAEELLEHLEKNEI